MKVQIYHLWDSLLCTLVWAKDFAISSLRSCYNFFFPIEECTTCCHKGSCYHSEYILEKSPHHNYRPRVSVTCLGANKNDPYCQI